MCKLTLNIKVYESRWESKAWLYEFLQKLDGISKPRITSKLLTRWIHWWTCIVRVYWNHNLTCWLSVVYRPIRGASINVKIVFIWVFRYFTKQDSTHRVSWLKERPPSSSQLRPEAEGWGQAHSARSHARRWQPSTAFAQPQYSLITAPRLQVASCFTYI